MNIENLRRKTDYYQNVAPEWVRSVWPRIQSLNHFLKAHRDDLVANGGIAQLGRGGIMDVEQFPTVVKQILGIESSV